MTSAVWAFSSTAALWYLYARAVVGDALAPPLACVAGLLIAAGFVKLAEPAGAVESLRSVGISAGSAVVRVLSAAEIVLGAVALGAGGPAGGLIVAVIYSGFAGFGLVVSRRGERPVDCGCFGAAGATSGALHLAMNVAAAVIGVVAALASTRAPIALIAGQPAGVAVVLAIGTAAAVYAAYLTVTALPAAWGAFARRSR